MQCFSLLLLGMFLATLATLNFSLSLFVGLVASPLTFVGPALNVDPGRESESESESEVEDKGQGQAQGDSKPKDGATSIATPLIGSKGEGLPSSDQGSTKWLRSRREDFLSWLILQLLSPLSILLILTLLSRQSLGDILADAAFGWEVNGMWTQIVVWCVWWPAWLVGAVLVVPFT